jgi:hypothetical protein
MRAARVKEGTLRIIIVEPDHSEYQDFIQNARSYFTAVLHSEIHNVLPVLYCQYCTALQSAAMHGLDKSQYVGCFTAT